MKYLFLVYLQPDVQGKCPDAVFSTVAKFKNWLRVKGKTEKTATVYRMLRDPVPSAETPAELVTCWQTWKDGEQ